MVHAWIQRHHSWAIHHITFLEEPSQEPLGQICDFALLLPKVSVPWFFHVIWWYTPASNLVQSSGNEPSQLSA